MLGVGPRGPIGQPDGSSDRPGAAGAAGPFGVAAGLAEREAWVVLAGVAGVGPVTFGRLLARFGSAAVVLEEAGRPAALRALVEATVGPDGGGPTLTMAMAAEIRAAADDPWRWLEPIRRAGLGVLILTDEAYPARLRRIELPPPVLFLLGDPAALGRPRAVAVVGTRRPTAVGRTTATRIADAVSSRSATVVSGLALGIDGAAHAAALRAATPTIAVIGGGHERLYPSAHRGLADAIAGTGGTVVSEFPPETQPSRGTFPRRNRLISGLADATVVVEAGARSGALTTAAWALEQGRQLFLVPGRLDDPAVAGSLAFLREAASEARVVAGIPELLEDLGLADPGHPGDGRREATLASLGGTERVVAEALVSGLATVDELMAATGHSTATVLGALTLLEVRGLVLEAFGRYSCSAQLLPAAAGTRMDDRTATAASGHTFGTRREWRASRTSGEATIRSQPRRPLPGHR